MIINPGSSGTTVLQVEKTAVQTVFNSNVLVDDNQLTLAIAASQIYYLELNIQGANSGVVAGFKLSINAPAGCTQNGVWIGTAASISVLTTYIQRTDVAMPDIVGNYFTTAYDGWITVRGVVRTGGLSGALTVQWAQTVADASNTQVYKGSSFRLTKF